MEFSTDSAAEVKKSKRYPLSNTDINALLPGVPISTYARFGDAPPLDTVLDAHGRGIVLFVKSMEGGVMNGHWLAIVARSDSTVLLFDPYGGRTDPWGLDHGFVDGGAAELSELGESRPLLAPYFERRGYKPVYNTTRLQVMSSDIGTCGRHCVVRLWRANTGDAEYKEWITGFGVKPDEVVTRLTDDALDASKKPSNNDDDDDDESVSDGFGEDA